MESQRVRAAAEAASLATAAAAEEEEEKRKRDLKAMNPIVVDLPPGKRAKVDADIDVCAVPSVPCNLKLRARDGESVPMQLVLGSKAETNKKVVRDHRSSGIGTVLGLRSYGR